MDAIRKAIEEACREFSSGEYYSRMRIQEKLMLIESLLPPEGETREAGHVEQAEIERAIRTGGYSPITSEPAPSSEKALREAFRLLELWYTWQAEATEVRMADDDYLNIVTPTAALLASSPVPKTFDEAIAQAGGTGIAEFERKAPAPETPKEEQFPLCVGCKRDGLQRRVGLCQDCGRHIKPDYYERSATT